MNTLNNYEAIRNAFVEGKITRQKFIELAQPFSSDEMLKVESKHSITARLYRVTNNLKKMFRI